MAGCPPEHDLRTWLFAAPLQPTTKLPLDRWKARHLHAWHTHTHLRRSPPQGRLNPPPPPPRRHGCTARAPPAQRRGVRARAQGRSLQPLPAGAASRLVPRLARRDAAAAARRACRCRCPPTWSESSTGTPRSLSHCDTVDFPMAMPAGRRRQGPGRREHDAGGRRQAAGGRRQRRQAAAAAAAAACGSGGEQ